MIQKISSYKIYPQTIQKTAAKNEINFTSRKSQEDPLMGFLDYLESINREIVIPDDKFLAPEEELFPITHNKNGRDIYDLKIRKLDYLADNKIQDIEYELKPQPEHFFISIIGYGKSMPWARYMAECSNFAALQIKQGEPFDVVFDTIAQDCADWELANIKSAADFMKAASYGVLREEDGTVPITPYDLSGIKYGAYGERYKNIVLEASKDAHIKTFRAKTPQDYPDFIPTTIYYNCGKQNGKLVHPSRGIKATLQYTKEIYDELTQKYLNKKLTKKDTEEINTQIASMHWLLVQSMPFSRGSDAIINVFIKSLYCALGFEMSPPEKGISFDLEAFCSEFDDYVKKYPYFYENEPKYVL